jgi:acetylglutamate kinase
VFGDPALTRALVEQIAILHYLGIRVVMAGGGRAHRGHRSAGRADTHGAGTPRHRREVDRCHSMVLNGLINTRILAICRDLGIDAVSSPASTPPGCTAQSARREDQQRSGEMVDYGFVGDIDSIDTTITAHSTTA